MTGNEKYLSTFKEFARETFQEHIPDKGSSGDQMQDLMSYLTDIPVQLKKIDSKLTNEINRLLNLAEEENLQDVSKLQEDLIQVVKNYHNEWITMHKPG